MPSSKSSQNNRKVSRPLSSAPKFPANPHSAVIYRNPSYAPPRTRRTLRYCENLVLTGTSGAIGFNGFALNGAYDPNTTGAGHQPLGWDQYMAIYQRACVHSVRITAEFVLSGTTVPTLCAITGFPGSTITTSVLGRVELGLTQYKVVPATNAVPVSLSAVFDLKQFAGCKDMLDEPDLWCTQTANPANVFGCQVWIRDLNGTSTAVVQVLVLMEFDITFLQPSYVAES